MKRRVRRRKTDDGNSGDGAGRLLCGAGDAVPVQGGGAGGGGAVLTDEARQIMDAYGEYCRRLNEYGQTLFGELFGFCAKGE